MVSAADKPHLHSRSPPLELWSQNGATVQTYGFTLLLASLGLLALALLAVGL
jgi:hypothetical protein